MSKRVSLIGLLALLGVLAVSLFGSASARSDSSAGGIRTLRTPTRVTGLAADGSVAAVATACSSGYGVYSLYSWSPIRRSVVSMARPRQRRCYESSTGEGIWEAGIGGPRLAWVHFSGGNYQQASLATASSRKPWSVRFLTGQLDRNTGSRVGDWVGNVHGDGRLLVFNTWSVCESLLDPSSCPKGIRPGQRVYDEKIWRIVGRRKTLILASRGQAAVVAVAAGRILVRCADGSLQLRKADGRLLHRFPFEPREVRGAVLDASELVVLDRNNGLTWRVYDPASGHEKGALPALPHAAGQYGQVAADVEHGLLVYTIGRVVHVLRLSDGRESSSSRPPSSQCRPRSSRPGCSMRTRGTTRAGCASSPSTGSGSRDEEARLETQGRRNGCPEPPRSNSSCSSFAVGLGRHGRGNGLGRRQDASRRRHQARNPSGRQPCARR